MSTFMANASVWEQYFLASNVQVIKLIANRRIYEYDFLAMVHVWYAFSVTGIFATDRQTCACKEREGKEKRQIKKYERSTSFLRDSSWAAVDKIGRHPTKSVKRFSITIAVTTSTEKAMSRDNQIP